MKKEALNQAYNYFKLGVEAQSRNDTKTALEFFEASINADPTYAPAYEAGGDIFNDHGQFLPALDCYGCGIRNDNQNIHYKDKFISSAQNLKFKTINNEIVDLLTLCLETRHVEVFYFGSAWKNILNILFKDSFGLLYQEKEYESFCKTLEKTKQEFLSHPFFIAGLKKLRVPDMQFELFLVHLRRAILDESIKNKALAEGLALYCFNTDYIFPVSEQEKQKLETEKDDTNISCYKFTKTIDSNVKKIIPALTPIKDAISEKVRAQYETMPYPRWETFSRNIYNEDIEGRLRNKKAKILNAGCGTGHEAVELATVFPDAEILAVDLSLSSLAYARQKTEELEIKNIRFAQADIMELGEISETFDFIASSGVLHHLENPLEGWRILIKRLKSHGLMRIALYSELGRQPIVEARKIIEEKRYKAEADDIRRFRYEAEKYLKPQSWKKISASREFYNLSECTDLLFHAQEHRMALPQIKNWLDELNLKFLGFQLRSEVFSKFKKNPLNLDDWAEFEEKNPDTFIGMYRFWCEKKD